MFKVVIRRVRAVGLGILALCLMLGAAVASDLTVVSIKRPYVVHTDYGGSVQARLSLIRTLRQSQRPVEVRGAKCLSSCTMLLGLPTTCVDPATVFGFHGPSRNGRPLDPSTFNHVSQVIALNYPAQLRPWYMSVARFSLTELHTLTGAELIKMNAARPCAAARRG